MADLTRRGFLKMLGMAAPVAAVAPKYFFAPIGGWTSDVIVRPFDLGRGIGEIWLYTSFMTGTKRIFTSPVRISADEMRKSRSKESLLKFHQNLDLVFNRGIFQDQSLFLDQETQNGLPQVHLT